MMMWGSLPYRPATHSEIGPEKDAVFGVSLEGLLLIFVRNKTLNNHIGVDSV